MAPAPPPINGTVLLATNVTTALLSRGSEILGDVLLARQDAGGVDGTETPSLRFPSSISSGEIIPFTVIARIHIDLETINRFGGIAASFTFVLCWRLAREI